MNFIIKGTPKEIDEQVDAMVAEEERLVFEKRMADGDDAERSEKDNADKESYE